MKRLIILFLVFFAAVAVSPLLINEKGYILIAMGDLTIESTVVTAVIMLVLLFIGLMFALKVFKGGLNIGFDAWNMFAFASQRRRRRNFNKGIASYVLEDYKQAEDLLVKSTGNSNLDDTAYLVAASAADKQNLPENTKHYLSLIEDNKTVKNNGLDSVLVRIQLFISQKDYTSARELIDKYHIHIGHDERLLVLEIEMCLIEQRYDAVIDYLIQARKSKVIDDSKIIAWEEEAFKHQFSSILSKQDQSALEDYWKSIAKKVRARESVVFTYCNVLANANIVKPLEKILLAPVKKGASSSFLKQMRKLPISQPDALIALVQKHLHRDTSSAKWLSALGHLALSGQQWQMAEKAFNSLLALEGKQYDEEDLAALAKTLVELNKHQEANAIYQKLLTQ